MKVLEMAQKVLEMAQKVLEMAQKVQAMASLKCWGTGLSHQQSFHWIDLYCFDSQLVGGQVTTN